MQAQVNRHHLHSYVLLFLCLKKQSCDATMSSFLAGTRNLIMMIYKMVIFQLDSALGFHHILIIQDAPRMRPIENAVFICLSSRLSLYLY